MIKLDGSYLEGGGQILRTALAFSAITLQPVEITEIRKGRPNPGIQPQHLACIRALEEMCNASSEGAQIGSSSVKFFPGKIQSRTYSLDIGTAGSVTLLLQALLLPSLFAPGKVRLKLAGGTNVSHSPPSDYFGSVLLPHLGSFGKLGFSLLQRGYFPKGSGKVELEIKPFFHLEGHGTFNDLCKSISPQPPRLALSERGKLVKISGVSHASGDLRHAEVAERQAKAARLGIVQALQRLEIDCPISIQSEYSNSLSTGSGISLFAHFAEAGKDEPSAISPIILGADALGERAKSSEAVGMEAANALVAEIASGACVDRHLADQLIPFMAISGGVICTSELTNHCLTNIFIVEKFIGKRFDVDESRKLVSSLQ